jgi:hypothetical protein
MIHYVMKKIVLRIQMKRVEIQDPSPPRRGELKIIKCCKKLGWVVE